MRLEVGRSLLLVVDVQELPLANVNEPAQVLLGCARLVKGARQFGVPVMASEQDPGSHGAVIGDLRHLLPDTAPRAKRTFSCMCDPAIASELAGHGRDQVVVAGIEAHVAVLQTALDLKAKGYAAFVVADAVGSRAPESRALALARLSAAGIAVVNVEMVLLEWLGATDHPAFTEIADLI
jgi:nicotinamidase-related amidase